METIHEKYMKLAIKEAKKALKDDQLPVGAIVVVNNSVVGRGRKRIGGNMWLDHAEICSLRKALNSDGQFHNQMVLYTTLEPCVMCFGTILNCRIRKVCYSLEDPYGGATHFPKSFMPVRHKVKFPTIKKGVLREDVKVLFRNFFLNTKNEYWKSHSRNPLVRLCLSENTVRL